MVMHQSDFKLTEHKFLLETFSEDKLINQIHCYKPIKKVFSLSGLNAFLIEHPEILEKADAGLAGYISYEGDMEFIIYEEIKKSNLNEDHYLKESQKETEVILRSETEFLKFKREEYINKIKLCQKYIEEGDIYQANLSEKIETKIKLSDKDLEDLYHKLKLENPAPYSAFLNYENYVIISSSPESFLKIYREETEDIWMLESSPIKGTSRLDKKNELLISEKERAEHIMIVDLIRNDLGRISKTGSVKVSEFLEIKKFKNLFHLVSKISSMLDESNLLKISSRNKLISIPNLEKIFNASFPGGSITGTPKIRAMEIIRELEKVKRGPYTGSIGYFKFQEGGEFNIIIRTLVYDKINQELSFHSGAGITSSSNPEEEFKEIELKAEKVNRCLWLSLIIKNCLRTSQTK